MISFSFYARELKAIMLQRSNDILHLAAPHVWTELVGWWGGVLLFLCPLWFKILFNLSWKCQLYSKRPASAAHVFLNTACFVFATEVSTPLVYLLWFFKNVYFVTVAILCCLWTRTHECLGQATVVKECDVNGLVKILGRLLALLSVFS